MANDVEIPAIPAQTGKDRTVQFEMRTPIDGNRMLTVYRELVPVDEQGKPKVAGGQWRTYNFDKAVLAYYAQQTFVRPPDPPYPGSPTEFTGEQMSEDVAIVLDKIVYDHDNQLGYWALKEEGDSDAS